MGATEGMGNPQMAQIAQRGRGTRATEGMGNPERAQRERGTNARMRGGERLGEHLGRQVGVML